MFSAAFVNHQILEVYIEIHASEEDVNKVNNNQVNRRFFA